MKTRKVIRNTALESQRVRINVANFKRKKSKRSVKCTMCTQNRWFGNNKGRTTAKDANSKKLAKKEIKDYK